MQLERNIYRQTLLHLEGFCTAPEALPAVACGCEEEVCCRSAAPGKSGLYTTSRPGLTCGGGGRAASNGLKNLCSYVSLEG